MCFLGNTVLSGAFLFFPKYLDLSIAWRHFEDPKTPLLYYTGSFTHPSLGSEGFFEVIQAMTFSSPIKLRSLSQPLSSGHVNSPPQKGYELRMVRVLFLRIFVFHEKESHHPRHGLRSIDPQLMEEARNVLAARGWSFPSRGWMDGHMVKQPQMAA